MRVTLVTYGTPNYGETLERLRKQAENSGWFDNIVVETPDTLDPGFVKKHSDILSLRGAGYWVWKPYIILRHLELSQENDIVVYLDAGCTINSKAKERFDEYLNTVSNIKSGILSFFLTVPNSAYIKGDVLDYFDVRKNEEVLEARMRLAGIQIIRKCKLSLKIIKEWNHVCSKHHLINDSCLSYNQPDFRDHRHDQSIFSLLCQKYEIPALKDETYFDNWLDAGGFPFWASRIRKNDHYKKRFDLILEKV